MTIVPTAKSAGLRYLVSSSMFRKFSRTSMICDVGNSLQRAALGVAAAYGQAAWFDSQWKKGCCEEEEGVISVPHLCHHLFGHLRRTGLQPGWFSNLTPESITRLDGYVVAPSNHEHIIVQSCRSNLSTFRTNAFFGLPRLGKAEKHSRPPRLLIIIPNSQRRRRWFLR